MTIITYYDLPKQYTLTTPKKKQKAFYTQMDLQELEKLSGAKS